MKDKIFFAEEIEFECPGEEIGKNEIDEIDDFPGKDDFIEFYTIHNGADFIWGAGFFPKSCYMSPMFRNSCVEMLVFLPIRVGDEEMEGSTIDTVRYRVEEKYESFEDFVLFHIPFALDMIDNPFWIDIETGEIKYIDFEKSTDPDDVITVASSFKEFCKQIKRLPY